MKVYGTIYKITNKIDGKIYIGKTTMKVEDRIKGHLKASTNCYYVGAALRKYGLDNFTIEEIHKSENKEDLSEKEKYFITVFNSLVPNGYNIIYGDKFVEDSIQNKNFQKAAKDNSGWARTQPIISYNIHTKKMTYFPRIIDAIKKTGLSKSIIEKNITFGRVSEGYIFSHANQSGSSRSNILEHAQRLEFEPEQSEKNNSKSVRVPRLYDFSEEEIKYIAELYKTRSAREVAQIVGLEESRCKKLLRKWGLIRTFEEAMKFRSSRRNIR